jgi:hypothetical protein
MDTNKKVSVIKKPKIHKKNQRRITKVRKINSSDDYISLVDVSLNSWNKDEFDIIGYMLEELNNMKIKTETVFNLCNGNEKELFFRCISEEGNTFYIRISEQLILELTEHFKNNDFKSNVDNNEIKYFKLTYNESFSYQIPVSLKMASLDVVGPSHNCVVYECSGGLCLVKRDKYLNCEESSFCFEGASEKDGVSSDLSFLVIDGFYIFSMTFELFREHKSVKNKDIVNQSIMKDIEYYCLKLKNLLYEKCMCLNENFIVKMRSLNKKAKYLPNLINTKLEEIYESINTLKKIKKEYIECPPVTNEDIENYNKVIYNLRIRQNMLVDIMGLYSSFIKDNNTIMLLNQSLKNKIEYIEDTYRDIDVVQV